MFQSLFSPNIILQRFLIIEGLFTEYLPSQSEAPWSPNQLTQTLKINLLMKMNSYHISQKPTFNSLSSQVSEWYLSHILIQEKTLSPCLVKLMVSIALVILSKLLSTSSIKNHSPPFWNTWRLKTNWMIISLCSWWAKALKFSSLKLLFLIMFYIIWSHGQIKTLISTFYRTMTRHSCFISLLRINLSHMLSIWENSSTGSKLVSEWRRFKMTKFWKNSWPRSQLSKIVLMPITKWLWLIELTKSISQNTNS